MIYEVVGGTIKFPSGFVQASEIFRDLSKGLFAFQTGRANGLAHFNTNSLTSTCRHKGSMIYFSPYLIDQKVENVFKIRKNFFLSPKKHNFHPQVEIIMNDFWLKI